MSWVCTTYKAVDALGRRPTQRILKGHITIYIMDRQPFPNSGSTARHLKINTQRQVSVGKESQQSGNMVTNVSKTIFPVQVRPGAIKGKPWRKGGGYMREEQVPSP